IYFTLLVISTVIPVALMAAPFAQAFWNLPFADMNGIRYYVPPFMWPVEFVIGFFGLFLMLHVARGIGRLHGAIAKHLLVKSGG
ncbi:MAG: sensor domain-containing protein, partial [Rhodanobacteraceae bacterium]